MRNPLDFKEFKHFLNFKNDDTGIIEITEVVGFDAAEFVIEQGDNYARDITLMAEETPLEFYKGFYEKSDTPQALPNGVIVYNLGMAIEYLFEYNKKYGFESQVEYILERNGVQFIPAELNFEKSESDELTYFKCNLVQNTQRALAKRREDIKINGFADIDLDGNPISPLVTENILLKAKPIEETSNWNVPDIFNDAMFGGTQTKVYFNAINNVLNYGVKNTLSYFPGVDVVGRDFGYIDAIEDLSDVLIKGSGINFQITSNSNNYNGTFKVYYRIGEVFESSDEVLIQDLGDGVGTPEIRNFTGVEFETTVNITRGNRLWVYFSFNRIIQFIEIIELEFYSGEISINATATAIDSVVKGTRKINLARQAIKATNGFNLENNDFDAGNKYGNLFAFSGNLIRQRDDVPFYFTLKDRMKNLMFRNYDIQMNTDNAFCLHYRDFYANVDNGGFVMKPNENFKGTYNERYVINSLEYQFKTYEKDRDESNTLDAVHTSTQWLINNTKVVAVKQIDVDDIYDPFSIEVQRKQAVKQTTALENDNKIFVIDTVPLAPTARGGFSARLKHQINTDDNTLKLLNDNSFSWQLLGFGIGDTFKILQGENIGEYTVLAFENSIITLQFLSGTLNFNGEKVTQVDYAFSNVLLTNRTNEGFSVIENIDNPNNFSNLAYTIRRNLVDWEEYLSTASNYISQDISNTEFINNGELITQLEGGIQYKENANIVLDNITPAILSPKLYETEVIVDYDEILSLINKYETLEGVGGFVRVQDTNGGIKRLYPKSFKYTWATKVLNIVGEERQESEFVIITTAGGIITINQVGYPIQQLAEVFYEINNDYIILFDVNLINLINLTKFDKFKINGQEFATVEELAQALSEL